MPTTILKGWTLAEVATLDAIMGSMETSYGYTVDGYAKDVAQYKADLAEYKADPDNVEEPKEVSSWRQRDAEEAAAKLEIVKRFRAATVS